MTAKQFDKKSYLWMSLLVLVLGSNFFLYRLPSISPMVLSEEAKWVIIGSLFDLAIVSPLLILAIYGKKEFFVKRFVMLMAAGLIIAKFFIPPAYFKPFVALFYLGFAIEGLLVLMLFLIVGRYIPEIIKKVRVSEESVLYSFPSSVEEKIRKYPVVQMLVSELLMFYYTFLSWRKCSSLDTNTFTLYKNSSLVPFQLMLIHAIIIETIGIHWWLHDKSIVLSIVLFILNVYTVLFFIGDIQAVRLNPVKLTDDRLYLSLGLAKKMILPLENIAAVTVDKELLEKQIDRKTTIEFIARDFETVYPHIILELKKPCRATLYLGMEKQYSRVALRMDDPSSFLQSLKERRQDINFNS